MKNHNLSKYLDHLINNKNSIRNNNHTKKFSENDIVIVSAARTPMGSYGGNLSNLSACELGAIVIRFALEKIYVNLNDVDEVYMGNVLQAGVGQNPARQALINSGIPNSCPATTINKVCASGMKAASIALGTIKLGYNDLVVCGGMESMSNCPHYVRKLRFGCKLGNQTLNDGLLMDGLWDCYNNCHMGELAELCAKEYNISRKQQDDYAIRSFQKAANNNLNISAEIVPITIPQKRGNFLIIKTDELLDKINLNKIRNLLPVFKKYKGTVTAGNASSLADGAAAIILMSGSKALKLNVQPLAKILSYADASQDPKTFTTAPSLAVPLALKRAGLTLEDLNEKDYFEINEAFSVVALANIKLMNLPIERTNIYGGGIAFGHPLGCSGARILITLLNILQQNKGRYGIAGICNGGGGASALILQIL